MQVLLLMGDAAKPSLLLQDRLQLLAVFFFSSMRTICGNRRLGR